MAAKEKCHAINMEETLQSNEMHMSNITNHVCPSVTLTQAEELPLKKDMKIKHISQKSANNPTNSCIHLSVIQSAPSS